VLGNSTGTTSAAINVGTGALNLGTNAIAHPITIGNVTGATTVAINAGTGAAGAINIGTAAHATPITIGNVTGTTPVLINSGTAGVTINSTGAGTIGLASGNAVTIDATVASRFTTTGAGEDTTISSIGGSVNLAASQAAADAIFINASDAASGIAMNYGTGGMIITGANGALALRTGTGAINIGVDAVAHAVAIGNVTGATTVAINAGTGAAGAINIGTTANATPITIGNVTGTTPVVVNSGTAGFQVNTTGAGTVDINSADAFTIDSTKTSTITVTGATQDLNLSSVGGSIKLTSDETVVTAVHVQAVNGGIFLDAGGLVEVAPAIATVASPGAAATVDTRLIRVIFTGFTTAANADQVFTLNSTALLATSGVLVQVTNLNASGNAALMTQVNVTQIAGTLEILTHNSGAGALGAGDHVIITAWILN
jgi:hypothetical protein